MKFVRILTILDQSHFNFFTLFRNGDVAKKFVSVKKKLLLGVLGVSTLVTTIVTFINFYFDYKQELQDMHEILHNIEISFLPPLAKSIWDFNDQQIKSQLESLTQVPFITDVTVIDAIEKNKTYNFHNENYEANFTADQKINFDLNFIDDSNSEKVGTIQINISEKNLKEKLTKKIVVYFFLQLFKTLVISYLLLLLFQRLVTQHLETISKSVQKFKDSEFSQVSEIKIYGDDVQYEDEITQLTDTINTMAKATEQLNLKLKNELKLTHKHLEDERARSLYSSKMASLGELSSGIAHEINNPLSILSLKISQLSKTANALATDKQELFNKNIETLQKMTTRISQIVRGLKNFSRESTHDPFISTSVLSIIEDTQLLVYEKIKKHSIKFEVFVEESDFTIECRSGEISQVLINLIGNSVDAIKGTTTPWIRLECHSTQDHFAQFTITDSGLGISTDLAQKIMDPFFTTKPIGEGTGLGLSISKGLIQRHGGELSLNPNSTHTQFVIKLPIKQTDASVKQQLA